LAKPENRFGRPLFRNDEDNLSCHENDREQATHALNSLDTHIFDVQTLLLIKAIAMFDASTQTPIVINLLNGGDTSQWDVGDQDQLSVQSFVIGNEYPQRFLCTWDSDLEPTKMDRVEPGLSGMFE